MMTEVMRWVQSAECGGRKKWRVFKPPAKRDLRK